MGGKNYREGVISQGIRTPIIKPGDDLQEIVITSVAETNGGQFGDGDIIGITEAVVAISQKNFVSYDDIAKDIMNKFPGAKELVLVDPIQSRNRFLHVLKAIVETPTLEKVYVPKTEEEKSVFGSGSYAIVMNKRGLDIKEWVLVDYEYID